MYSSIVFFIFYFSGRLYIIATCIKYCILFDITFVKCCIMYNLKIFSDKLYIL